MSEQLFLKQLTGYKTQQYKSKQASLFFSPVTRYITKNSYGQQLDLDAATKPKQIKYKGTKLTGIQQGVNKYVMNYTDTKGKLKVFRSNLRLRLDIVKQQVNNYSLQQIADFYPWVMSCQLLFQPLRTIIYCLGQGLKADKVKQVSNMQVKMVNQITNKSLWKAIKYNTGLTQQAKGIFNAKQGTNVTKQWIDWINKTTTLSSAFISAIQVAGRAMLSLVTFKWVGSILQALNLKQKKTANDLILKKLTGTTNDVKVLKQNIKKQYTAQQLNIVKTQDSVAVKELLGQYVNQIFSSLRPYGQLLINFGYLDQTADKKVVQGTLVYFYPDKPQILIGIRNSYPVVYKLQQMKLVVIPQTFFTINFLRKLIQVEAIQYSARMMASVQDAINQTEQQKKGLVQFNDKYLSWDDKQRYDKAHYEAILSQIDKGKQSNSLKAMQALAKKLQLQSKSSST